MTTDLCQQRLERWGQSPATRVRDPREAVELIARFGVMTHFPTTAELPNLFHAYTGDPAVKVMSEHSGASGEVYTWRWKLGWLNAGFYTAIVRKRPTWVSWGVLPAVLRLCGELRTVDETFDAGELTPGAYRIAQALEAAGGILGTGELRKAAGFPTGKDQRAAFLKAVAELDNRLMVSKVFQDGQQEMQHALVEVVYQDQLVAASATSNDAALDILIATYLPNAVFCALTVLAKDLRVAEPELRAALDRAVNAGLAAKTELSGYKGVCYASVA